MIRLWQRLSKRERGLSALALFIFLLLLGRYLLLTPFLEHRGWVRDQLELQPRLLQKNRAYLHRKAQIMAGLELSRAEMKTLGQSFLSGDTPSVSASALQEIVREIAGNEKVRILNTRVLKPERVGPFLRIPIRIQVNGEIGQVVNLIKGIESDSRLLVVDEVNVRSMASAVRRRRRRTILKDRRGLRVTLVISGFARNHAAKLPES